MGHIQGKILHIWKKLENSGRQARPRPDQILGIGKNWKNTPFSWKNMLKLEKTGNSGRSERSRPAKFDIVKSGIERTWL
jgi:hypothetical protein